MYCPRCGQEQASADVRFCSRCGFALASVSNLLETGGLVPVAGTTGDTISARRRGVRIGAKVLFVGIALWPLFLGLSILFDSPAPLLLGFLPLFAGVLRMTYARFFEEEAAPGVLPPYSPPPRIAARTTGELAPPPSVTENTTRFLDS
jgi:hypothetical protein